ncbi:hypothetical protein [Paenibacillus xerothermodurans]|uniref:Lipoprotein n=1 Tax=Paenibacillus xerothermodurans TaxID=1977292 RepID=A0A2W1N5N6_PAEXE|nr:hypothetical protein [Paenibacillus xerothermodurans]PZE19697.1 hypothetical protein CBW46_017345 [Paenibacillus xerothermodurans]
MQNNKVKKKAGVLLSLAALGALAIVSSHSLVSYAQSTMDSKKNVVMTEAQPPKDLVSEETAKPATQPEVSNKDTGTAMVFPVAMSKEQAEPFIQAAKQAFKAKNIELPDSGYWISSRYVDNNTQDVQIDWYPNSFDGLGPVNFIKDKVYFVYFTNADLNKGTGDVQNVRVIEKGGFPRPSAQ